MNFQHGSDAEEIFESIGEETVLETQFSVSSLNSGSVAPETEIAIAIENPGFTDSFQYFHQYDARKYDAQQWSLASKQEIDKRVESPFERYQRLKNELQSLQQDLQNISDTEREKKANIWTWLESETEKVVQESLTLENHEAWKILNKAHPLTKASLEQEVYHQLQDQLQHLSEEQQKLEKFDGKKLVYNQVTMQQFLQLEKRIHRLETFLGHHTNTMDLQASIYPEHYRIFPSALTIGATIPLVKVAQQLTERLTLLDVKTLDTIKTKTKILRNDLEALTSGTSSAGTSSSSVSATTINTTAGSAAASAGATEIKIFEAAKKIEALAEKVKQIEGIVDDLPIIVTRLKTLEKVHWNATTITNRVEQLEADSKELSTLVHNNREVLDVMKEKLQENLKIMQENIAAVDARLLAAKSST
jgi:hypothetical protein